MGWKIKIECEFIENLSSKAKITLPEFVKEIKDYKTIEVESTPQIKGMVAKVLHLVRVVEK